MMNGPQKSDLLIVAMKPANKADGAAAEQVERRGETKGNTGRSNMCRTPSRESMSQGLLRVRERAKRRKKERFTALLHHVDIILLRESYFRLKRQATPGVDGVTWKQYGRS